MIIQCCAGYESARPSVPHRHSTNILGLTPDPAA
jgi:hypothetical protein